MIRLSLLTLAVLALLPIASTLCAQYAAPAPPSEPPQVAETPPIAPGPNLMEFQKQLKEWKKFLTQLQSLRTEYVSASDKEKKVVKAKYEKLVEQASTLQPKLIDAAEKAYVENPKADPQIQEFLKAACFDNFRMDNYEEAYRLAKMLLDQGDKAEIVQLVGGASAFCIGKLDDAEKLLKPLKKPEQPLQTSKGYLDGMIDGFLNEPATYKKAWAAEQKIRAKEAKADDLPRVRLKTSVGDIVIELFENEAPNTTANIISLVENGFYDGLTFHRVLDSFMAQGGCPKGTGNGGPGYKIPCECYRPDARKHFRGSLSMAKTPARDTGGSQFFLTFVPTTSLDGKHTVFGRVIEGIETLSKIQKRDPDKPNQPAPDKIIEAKVIRKRDHKYVPKKVGK